MIKKILCYILSFINYLSLICFLVLLFINIFLNEDYIINLINQDYYYNETFNYYNDNLAKELNNEKIINTSKQIYTNDNIKEDNIYIIKNIYKNKIVSINHNDLIQKHLNYLETDEITKTISTISSVYYKSIDIDGEINLIGNIYNNYSKSLYLYIFAGIFIITGVIIYLLEKNKYFNKLSIVSSLITLILICISLLVIKHFIYYKNKAFTLFLKLLINKMIIFVFLSFILIILIFILFKVSYKKRR